MFWWNTPSRHGVAALAHATHYLGVHEQPANSNSGPHIDAWLRNAGVPPGNPWCMAFVHGMFLEAGVNLGGGASVGNFEEWGRSHGKIVQPDKIIRGDVVCYEWEHDSWPDHVGICSHRATRLGKIVHWDGSLEQVNPGDVIAIEGNTAIGNDSNGGRVMYRSRWQGLCLGVRVR